MVAIGAKAKRGAEARTRRQLEEHEFSSLYARTARPLGAYLRRMTSDSEVAKDLVHETYLRILRAEIPEMSGKELNAYLYKTASRLVSDRWRHRQVDQRWRERLPERRQAADGDSGRALDVDRVLGRLRPRERAIVWLAYVEGRSHAEIADILGLRAGSVRVMLFRARKRLAGLLRDAGLAPEGTT